MGTQISVFIFAVYKIDCP